MRRLALAALLLVAPALTGCIVECHLQSDGSGRLRIRYHLDENATLGTVAQRLDGASVTVRSGRIDRDGIATFKALFADVSKLSTTQMFRNVTFTRAAGSAAGTVAWTAKLVQPKPIQLPEKLLKHYGNDLKVTVVFPGPVVDTNATSHEGATATWVLPLQTVTSSAETSFTATYKDAGAPSGGG
jgi:hypothetical protein